MSIILIEGADGAGKTFHSARLAEMHNLRWFQFPNYETPTGKLIKSWLKREWRVDSAVPTPDGLPQLWDPIRDATVFQALQLTNKVEASALVNVEMLAGHDILFTRYWPSAFVYGVADGLDPTWLVSVRDGLIDADLNILLDIDPAHAFERREAAQRDRYEQDAAYQEEICLGYRDLWRRGDYDFMGEWHVVDARGSKEETAAQIDDLLLRLV